jgi:cyclohexa-1,5-dienecarbonyl-CoA hydratase
VIAEEDATLANPEIQLGVLAPAATALFTGRAAEDLVLTGRSFTAAEAQAMGIVNVVTTTGTLDQTLDTFAGKYFVPRSALSLRVATRAVRRGRLAEAEVRLAEAERLYTEELLPTHDGVEGIKAFMEKRKPEWTND